MLATTWRKQFAALPSISMRTRDTRRRESKVENRDQLTTNRWFVNKKRLASSKRNRNSILDSKRKKKKKVTQDLIKKKYWRLISLLLQFFKIINYHWIYITKLFSLIKYIILYNDFFAFSLLDRYRCLQQFIYLINLSNEIILFYFIFWKIQLKINNLYNDNTIQEFLVFIFFDHY